MKIRSKAARRHRGAVLILVLVMLGLLAMLAISLATSSVLDRSVSHNYIDEVRARLVARAGVEHAISRIQSMVQRGRFDDPSLVYWGAKVAETGDPDEDTPLAKALNPSYAIEDEAVQNPDDEKNTPAKFKFDDREVGISGTMSASAYGVHSDVYRLRVSDANSRINVNDGLDDPSVTKNLRRILNHLGAACKVKNVGDRLIEKRPLVGYRTRKELKKVLGDADYAKVNHHITVYAWSDKNVVNPVPLSESTLGAYPVNYNEKIALYRYGRSRTSSGAVINMPLTFAPDYANPSGFDHAVMAMDEVSAQWISRTERSPVNINAASYEVLVALISDLRGIFMTERRKKNPGGGEYTFMYYPQCNNMPGGQGSFPIGAELGFLYSTAPFIGPAEAEKPGTGTGGGVHAKVIADEIIACRTGSKSKAGGYDYGASWFGGQFRTWRQFNAFCDDLVRREILTDSRAIYYDYAPTDGGSGGYFGADCGSDSKVPSGIQPRIAAQALADVLKANFNPNCSLNELNPDRNMFLEVDKTDLICNSTEFCFTPMGVFDIECEGIIVKTARADDLMKSRTGVMQAREAIECIVRVYDVYRETTQSDFYKGDLGLRLRRLMTNSNYPIELGPEPQAGENPEECKWSGYIQLSTIGGIRRPDIKNAVQITPKAGQTEFGASAFGHFQYDHRLNYHASDQPHPLQFSGGSGNQPDRTEQHAGPYNPTRASRGEYRLARDWKQDDPPPGADYKTMSDLRIDGAYIERDGALLYPCTADVFATVGTVAFWVKPAFKPECAGKPRTFFSTDTFVDGWQLINGLWFFASHDHMPYQSSVNESLKPQYASGPWRPVCLCGGYATKGSYGGGVGHQTPSLNHLAHKNCQMPQSIQSSPNVMKHHEWMHVAYCWDMSGQNVHLMVNGISFSETPPEVFVHPQPTTAADWTSENAIFRIGEPSSTMSYGGSRNWTIDGTIDEFYMWKGKSFETVAQFYDRGRYHVPRFGQEGVFTSGEILREGSGSRVAGQKLPEPSSARPPINPRADGSGNRTTTAGPLDGPRQPDLLRPICAFWTWYPEVIDADGTPMMIDGLKEAKVKIDVKMVMLLEGEEIGETMTDDGGSAIVGIGLKKNQKFQYRLKISLAEGQGGSLLRATPVIDDVTIFFTAGVEYIHYNRIDLDTDE